MHHRSIIGRKALRSKFEIDIRKKTLRSGTGYVNFGRRARDRPRRGANERGRATAVGGSKMRRLFYATPPVQLDNEELLQRIGTAPPLRCATISYARPQCHTIVTSLVACIRHVSSPPNISLAAGIMFQASNRHSFALQEVRFLPRTRTNGSRHCRPSRIVIG